MRVYLADTGGWFSCCMEEIKDLSPYLLQSFYYTDSVTDKMLPYVKDFLLDSGAFTFLANAKSVDWDDYVERYASYINDHQIKKFFELDIDSVIGYDKVKQYRRSLEKMTGKQCIPVWHKNRGYDEFLSLCDEYDYIAIGGIAIKDIKPAEYKYFDVMIRDAHRRNTRVHGLGFTNLTGIRKYHFDSVDSSTWTGGSRFGVVYQFNGNTIIKHKKPEGHRIASARDVTRHNFIEWVKFQQYADSRL